MDYYTRKTKAFQLIDRMVEANKTRQEIHLGIARTYGFGRKFVDEYLDTVGYKE